MLRPLISAMFSDCGQLFTGETYSRLSEADAHHRNIVSLVKRCGSLIQDGLDPESRNEFRRPSSLSDPQTFENERKANNRRFLDRQVPLVKQSVRNALNTRLTDEQAEAIATDENVTLVLAGAGTGKTSVIVGKLAHLVRDRGVSPEEVLVLAFNRKAAREIRERLPGELKGAYVSTFHSLGYRIIAESDVAPTVSRLAADRFAFTAAIDTILGELLNDQNHSRSLAEFIAYRQAPYRSAFEFRSRTEYDEYVRSIELRTLSGDLVRSYEELVNCQLSDRARCGVQLRAFLRGPDRHTETPAVPARLLPAGTQHLYRALRPGPQRQPTARMRQLRRGRHLEARDPREVRDQADRDLQLVPE